MINHGFIEIRPDVVKTNDEKNNLVVSPPKFDTCITAILTQVRKVLQGVMGPSKDITNNLNILKTIKNLMFL